MVFGNTSSVLRRVKAFWKIQTSAYPTATASKFPTYFRGFEQFIPPFDPNDVSNAAKLIEILKPTPPPIPSSNDDDYSQTEDADILVADTTINDGNFDRRNFPDAIAINDSEWIDISSLGWDNSLLLQLQLQHCTNPPDVQHLYDNGIHTDPETPGFSSTTDSYDSGYDADEDQVSFSDDEGPWITPMEEYDSDMDDDGDECPDGACVSCDGMRYNETNVDPIQYYVSDFNPSDMNLSDWSLEDDDDDYEEDPDDIGIQALRDSGYCEGTRSGVVNNKHSADSCEYRGMSEAASEELALVIGSQMRQSSLAEQEEPLLDDDDWDMWSGGYHSDDSWEDVDVQPAALYRRRRREFGEGEVYEQDMSVVRRCRRG